MVYSCCYGNTEAGYLTVRIYLVKSYPSLNTTHTRTPPPPKNLLVLLTHTHKDKRLSFLLDYKLPDVRNHSLFFSVGHAAHHKYFKIIQRNIINLKYKSLTLKQTICYSLNI